MGDHAKLMAPRCRVVITTIILRRMEGDALSDVRDVRDGLPAPAGGNLFAHVCSRLTKMVRYSTQLIDYGKIYSVEPQL